MEKNDPTTSRLYSSGQIGLATFLGSPIAGCWFFAHNYRQLGKPDLAKQCLLWGSLGTVVLLIIAYFLPDGFPNAPIPIALTIILRQAAERIHGKMVTQHLAEGGRLGSWWTIVGVSLFLMIIIFAAIFGVVFLLPDGTV